MRASAFIGTEDTNQAFFLDILRTIPVDVYYAEVSFLAEGIPRTDMKGFNENEYIESCRNNGVIPFSRLDLGYDSRSKAIAPRTEMFDSILGIYSDSSEARKKAALKGFLKGGKVHLLEFKSESYPFNYSNFQKEYLEQIVQANYQIDETDLWLNTYRLTGYNEGTHRKNGLKLGKTYFTKGVELELPELAGWFKDLARKHGVKVLQAQKV